MTRMSAVVPRAAPVPPQTTEEAELAPDHRVPCEKPEEPARLGEHEDAPQPPRAAHHAHEQLRLLPEHVSEQRVLPSDNARSLVGGTRQASRVVLEHRSPSAVRGLVVRESWPEA
eukprot:CAMPEP_0180401436 /NCGR_PEP_ID=MMETSP0989-20121125/38290_1 /TAXON_ID=697907 /ORGANISM="non described non described, Strain CCMP2293" /LENGTH=114 /DNA_ID=CAMNT_0022404403 /DNA_START=15 /DNA_END=356 /DNA_ORIENTATION=+